MENRFNRFPSDFEKEEWQNWRHKHSRLGRVLGGFVIVAIGALLLANQIGAIVLPAWAFTWKMGLIVFGVYMGAKHVFKHPGFLLPIVVGGIFLLQDINPSLDFTSYIWPVVIILIGAFMIFSPKRKPSEKWKKWKRQCQEGMAQTSDEDFLDSVSVCGGIKKNIISKNFKGGELVSVMGGTELNLYQADFDGRVEIDVSLVFGGLRLIIPEHWDVQYSDMVTVMGSIEDKRPLRNDINTENKKTLVLKGSCVMGGIDIRTH